MTNKSDLSSTIREAMSTAATNQTDFELNLQAVKGPEYTNMVKAVAAVISSGGLMSSMMCEGHPFDVRALVSGRFGMHVEILVSNILARSYPDIVRRKIEHQDFMKNVMIFVKSQSKLQDTVEAAFSQHLKEYGDTDSDPMDGNED